MIRQSSIFVVDILYLLKSHAYELWKAQGQGVQVTACVDHYAKLDKVKTKVDVDKMLIIKN